MNGNGHSHHQSAHCARGCGGVRVEPTRPCDGGWARRSERFRGEGCCHLAACGGWQRGRCVRRPCRRAGWMRRYSGSCPGARYGPLSTKLHHSDLSPGFDHHSIHHRGVRSIAKWELRRGVSESSCRYIVGRRPMQRIVSVPKWILRPSRASRRWLLRVRRLHNHDSSGATVRDQLDGGLCGWRVLPARGRTIELCGIRYGWSSVFS